MKKMLGLVLTVIAYIAVITYAAGIVHASELNEIEVIEVHI